jgi:DNA polymerase-3 subunit beta
MRIVANAGELAAAARAAASAVDDKTAKRLPILGTLLIDSTAEIIKFTATDLDIAITADAAGVKEEPGRSAVSAEALAKLLGGIAAESEVVVATANTRLLVKARASHYRLPALPPEDFPQPPASTARLDLVLSREEVQHLFGATAFSISDEKARYYLNGSYLHRDADGRLCVVATDTHQLALAVSAIDPSPDILPASGVIIPQKSVEQILKLKAKEIAFRIDANVLEARAANVTITTKLIDGTYPDYVRIIAAAAGAFAELDRGALLAAIGRMSAANAAHTKAWRLTLGWQANGKSDGVVRLEMAAGETAEDAIPAIISGDANIILSVDRFLKLVDNLEAKRLVLGIVSSTDPIRVRPADSDHLLAVLAPCLD